MNTYRVVSTQISKSKSECDGEYRVRLFIDGEYQAGADYYTDDKQDAIETAKRMQLNAVPSDKSTPIAIAEQAEYNEECGK